MGWINVGAGGRSLRRLFALGIAAALASTGTSRALPAGFKRGGRVNRRGLIAGAPISWGVIEILDWGHQMDRGRVLREAAAVGLEAMEAGPEVFLPQDPAEVSAALSEHGLGLVGGSSPPCCTSQASAGRDSTSWSVGPSSSPPPGRTRWSW